MLVALSLPSQVFSTHYLNRCLISSEPLLYLTLLDTLFLQIHRVSVVTVSTHSVHIDNSDIHSHHTTGRVFSLFFFLIYSPTPTPTPYPSPLLLSRFRATAPTLTTAPSSTPSLRFLGILKYSVLTSWIICREKKRASRVQFILTSHTFSARTEAWRTWCKLFQPLSLRTGIMSQYSGCHTAS